MNNAERHLELMEQQLAAARAMVAVQARLAFVAEAPIREERERLAETRRHPPGILLAGKRGLRTLMAMYPVVGGDRADGALSFAELWQTRVPDGYLWTVAGRIPRLAVRCVCNASTLLSPAGTAIDECDGGCGRWFLRTETDVRSHRFEAQEVGE